MKPPPPFTKKVSAKFDDTDIDELLSDGMVTRPPKPFTNGVKAKFTAVSKNVDTWFAEDADLALEQAKADQHSAMDAVVQSEAEIRELFVSLGSTTLI